MFGLGDMLIFFMMVFTQEYHLPHVATQKTLLPCPMPAPDTTAAYWVDMFDTSVMVQNLYNRLSITSPVSISDISGINQTVTTVINATINHFEL